MTATYAIQPKKKTDKLASKDKQLTESEEGLKTHMVPNKDGSMVQCVDFNELA